jgi:transcriptional regulator of acetoin/glycerol metabolism
MVSPSAPAEGGNPGPEAQATPASSAASRAPGSSASKLPAAVRLGAAAELHPGDLAPLSEIEQEHIRRVLAQAGTPREAAAILGIDQATLWRRRKQHQL